jgi:hypothetical protein
VNWYQSVFELIDMRSFSNLWYWIILAVAWSSASHWVLGVPFDMVTRARRHGGEADADLTTMVRINANRLVWISQVSGLWLMAAGFFTLTVLAVLGFWYRVEFAQAVLLIMAPMALVFALTLRAARRALSLGQGGEPLYKLLTRHRMLIQGIGMLSIFVTSLWGMYQNMQIGVLG